MGKHDNQGFSRILNDRLSKSNLTDFKIHSSIDPIARPRWMAENECEIFSLSAVLLFESDVSESERTELHQATILNFSRIEFLRMWNREIPPFPTSPIFVSGLPGERLIGWESAEYGEYLGSGSVPCIWQSYSSELCKLIESRQNRRERIKEEAHYVVRFDRVQLEVFGVLCVDEQNG